VDIRCDAFGARTSGEKDQRPQRLLVVRRELLELLVRKVDELFQLIYQAWCGLCMLVELFGGGEILSATVEAPVFCCEDET